ncbi:MAG: hypothetical protein COW63_14875, partial [Bacteroidetes bacterium CG18_big_fil_WC_8_21_14_2_50_41_14]
MDSYSQTDITCYNGNDGTITVIASGGTLPLIYTLTPGNIVNYDGLFTGLSSGTYTISVTDDNSCPAATIINIVINEPSPITILTAVATDITCHDLTDGSIAVTATGGTGILH